MKSRNYRHSHRRTPRPAALKQQMLRKEARKRAKYPMKAVHVYSVRLQQARNRGS